NRPDLKGYREQLEIAKYQMYQTWSAYSPTVNAYVNFGYNTTLTRRKGWNGTPGNQPNRTYSESPSFGYGLTADWTIFNGLIRENRIREYKANLAVAEFTVAAQWLAVVSEVRTAYANYVQSVRQTRLYEKTRELSAQQRDLVDEGYKAGNVELTRLNEAQRDLVEAETNLASSYINIQNAKAQLDASVGANPAAYYGDPDNVAPGILRNTPIPAADQAETVPVAAPGNEAVMPPAPPLNMAEAQKDAGVPVTAPQNTPPQAPAIPADPNKVPEIK
ncbi:MAG: hypothetical protein EOM25_10760, partial [Deltaproteobacteria bacterium]|nr:hypothetical protein [Deltaproteobacteria bacterium]